MSQNSLNFFYPFRIRLPILSHSAIVIEHMEMLDEMHTICPHQHAFCEIYYCLEGILNLWIEGETHVVHPGNFIVIPSGVHHQAVSTMQQKKQFFVFNFDLDFRREMENRNDFVQQHKFIASCSDLLGAGRCLTATDSCNALGALHAIIREFDAMQPGWPLALRASCTDFFVRIFRNLLPSTKEAVSLSSEKNLSMELFRYISVHFQENIKLEDIAEAFHISPRHACRIFESCFGINMRYAIHASRINVAKDLLQNTDHRLEKIAELTGYTDSDSLVRWFKKLEGMTITQYRAKYCKSQEKK